MDTSCPKKRDTKAHKVLIDYLRHIRYQLSSRGWSYQCNADGPYTGLDLTQVNLRPLINVHFFKGLLW